MKQSMNNYISGVAALKISYPPSLSSQFSAPTLFLSCLTLFSPSFIIYRWLVVVTRVGQLRKLLSSQGMKHPGRSTLVNFVDDLENKKVNAEKKSLGTRLLRGHTN